MDVRDLQFWIREADAKRARDQLAAIAAVGIANSGEKGRNDVRKLTEFVKYAHADKEKLRRRRLESIWQKGRG